METFDAVIVGGGPAGSACARDLVGAGMNVAVLEQDVFPRTKLCAGWITPQAVAELDLDPAEYPHRFNTFDHLDIHVFGLHFRLKTRQHSIRRYELDDFLLQRAGAEVRTHRVREIEAGADGYVIDDAFRAPYLIGAGGTRCPVYRSLFRESNPRAKTLQTTTYEHEFPYAWRDDRCHLWFFRKGLPGYAWYVPKADGYLNCGIGAVADALKAEGQDIKSHWHRHVDLLESRGDVTGVQYAPKGYSYFLRNGVGNVRAGNAFIVGDAVGLATRDLGEGIGPAIASGRLAAKAILNGGDYSLDEIDVFSLPAMIGRNRWLSRCAERLLALKFDVAHTARQAANEA